MDIRGFSAVISGGASGLGAATARKIVEAGGLVTILDRDREKAKDLASQLGNGTDYVVADVSDENEVQAAIDVALGHAPLRAVINCAGIGIAERTIGRDGTPHSLAAFDRIIRVNLIGTFNLLRLGASAINKSEPLEFGERGVIINTA